jgi:hypothetical protein
MFVERLLLYNARFSLVMTKAFVIHVNPREEHDIQDDDISCGSYCSTNISTLVETWRMDLIPHMFLEL